MECEIDKRIKCRIFLKIENELEKCIIFKKIIFKKIPKINKNLKFLNFLISGNFV